MVNEIGQAAGQVYSFLNENGEVTLATLKKKVNGSADLVSQGIGWLAREDKVEVVKKGNSMKISLK